MTGARYSPNSERQEELCHFSLCTTPNLLFFFLENSSLHLPSAAGKKSLTPNNYLGLRPPRRYFSNVCLRKIPFFVLLWSFFGMCKISNLFHPILLEMAPARGRALLWSKRKRRKNRPELRGILGNCRWSMNFQKNSKRKTKNIEKFWQIWQEQNLPDLAKSGNCSGWRLPGAAARGGRRRPPRGSRSGPLLHRRPRGGRGPGAARCSLPLSAGATSSYQMKNFDGPLSWHN